MTSLLTERSRGNSNASVLIVGDLALNRILYVPALADDKPAAIVECTIDGQAMRLRINPTALDTFAAFRKTCLRDFGVLPRSYRLEETRPSRRPDEWDQMVDEAAHSKLEAVVVH